jgi:rubrerythrin
MRGGQLYYDYYHFRANPDLSLVNDISKAINGQYNAITCYERLAQLAPNENIRKRILEIRQDEIRHYQAFSQIFASFTGQQAKPQIVEGCPSDFRAGLHFAFKDEQETVDFYLEIAEKANNPLIKEQFRRASADEQNHAVWFLYFMISSH